MQRNAKFQLSVDELEATNIFNAIYEPQGMSSGSRKIKPSYLYNALTQAALADPAEFSNFNDVHQAYQIGNYFYQNADVSENAEQINDNVIPGELVLINAHAFFLTRESFLLQPSSSNGITETTRVFPPKDATILQDIDDLFRNGLSSFRAATTISYWDDQFKKNEVSYQKLLKVFCQDMQVYRDNYYNKAQDLQAEKYWLEQARQELAEFNGALARQLVDAKIFALFKHATFAMDLIRGYQFKMAYPERFCTIVEVDDASNPIKALFFSKPAVFPSSDYMGYFHEEHWYQDIKQKIGKREKKKSENNEPDWLDKFFAKNLDKLQTLSPVPMMRDTPNPSNANDLTKVFFSPDGKFLQSLNWGGMAITEPFAISSKGIKSQLTEFNHAQLMSDERIKAFVTHHFSQWQRFYAETAAQHVITLPYLHQTLVADRVVGSGDAVKSKTMLDNKARANQAMRDMLAKRAIFVNKNNPNDVRIFTGPATPGNIGKNYHRVTLKILEINNCVNVHEKRSRVRNHDLTDSRELLELATTQLETISKWPALKSEQAGNLVTVLEFLRSQDYSFFTPYKSRGNRVKTAIANFSKQLRKMHIPLAYDLDVLMRSAVELKCIVHETWLGSFRRYASNRVLQIPLIGAGINFFLLKIPSAVLKLGPWGWVGFAKWIKHHKTRRKTAYKSAYEILIASLLGRAQSGCMSNEDRGGVVGTLCQNLLLQYHHTGQMIGFNDDKRHFIARYCKSMQYMHDSAKMTSDVGIIKVREIHNPLSSSGLPSEYTPKQDQKRSKRLVGVRKGQYDAKVTPDVYGSYTTAAVITTLEDTADTANERVVLKGKHSPWGSRKNSPRSSPNNTLRHSAYNKHSPVARKHCLLTVPDDDLMKRRTGRVRGLS